MVWVTQFHMQSALGVNWTLQDEHIFGDILRRRWSARYGSTLDKAGAGPVAPRRRLGGVPGHGAIGYPKRVHEPQDGPQV